MSAPLLASCSSATETIPSAERTVAQDYQARVGGLSVALVNVYAEKVLGDPDSAFGSYKPRGIWEVVKLRVQNNSDEPHHFDGGLQHLLIDGRKYAPDTMASDAVDAQSRASASLNPGFAQEIAIAFDVPKSAPEGSDQQELVITPGLPSTDPPLHIAITG